MRWRAKMDAVKKGSHEDTDEDEEDEDWNGDDDDADDDEDGEDAAEDEAPHQVALAIAEEEPPSITAAAAAAAADDALASQTIASHEPSVEDSNLQQPEAERADQAISDYFASRAKNKGSGMPSLDLLFDGDLGALLSGAPADALPAKALPPPPAAASAAGAEGSAEAHGFAQPDAALFFSQQPTAKNKQSASEIWGALRGDGQREAGHIVTPVALTQAPSAVHHRKNDAQEEDEEEEEISDERVFSATSSARQAAVGARADDVDDDQEDGAEINNANQATSALDGYFSIFRRPEAGAAQQKIERRAMADKPVINTRNAFVEDEADIEEDEFMHEGGKEGDLAAHEGNVMEAESGDEDVIENFEDIKERFREEERAMHRKEVTDLINDLAEPGGLERKRRARRRKMADKYGDEFEDWDSDDEFAYWRRKRQSKTGPAAGGGIGSLRNLLPGAAPETAAFARAFYSGRRAEEDDDDDDDDDGHDDRAGDSDGGAPHRWRFDEDDGRREEETTLSRRDWLRMVEKENSRGGFFDDEAHSFLGTTISRSGHSLASGDAEADDLELPPDAGRSMALKGSISRGAFHRRSTLLSRTSSFAGLQNQTITIGASKEDVQRKAVLRKGMVFKASSASAGSRTTSTGGRAVSMSAALSNVLHGGNASQQSSRPKQALKSVDFGDLHQH